MILLDRLQESLIFLCKVTARETQACEGEAAIRDKRGRKPEKKKNINLETADAFVLSDEGTQIAWTVSILESPIKFTVTSLQ